MDIFLNVPYAEKDLAKSKGAKWNPTKKKWYIDDYKKLPQMKQWLEDDSIICESLYLLKKSHDCWKCKKSIEVVLLATDKSYAAIDNFKLNSNIQILTYVKAMPDELANFMKGKGYFPSFSKQVNEKYYVNHCNNCKMIQGDNFLHEIPEQAFYRKLCYSNAQPIEYAKIDNIYCVSLQAQSPCYDEICSSEELTFCHMETGVENRASLMVNQELINGLFAKSISGNNIIIAGL